MSPLPLRADRAKLPLPLGEGVTPLSLLAPSLGCDMSPIYTQRLAWSAEVYPARLPYSAMAW